MAPLETMDIKEVMKADTGFVAIEYPQLKKKEYPDGNITFREGDDDWFPAAVSNAERTRLRRERHINTSTSSRGCSLPNERWQ